MCVCVCVCVCVCWYTACVCVCVFVCAWLVSHSPHGGLECKQYIYGWIVCLHAYLIIMYVGVIHLSLPLCVCVSDDDDEEEHLDWLATVPETDEPEEAGWGQLEVSSTGDAGIQPEVTL